MRILFILIIFLCSLVVREARGQDSSFLAHSSFDIGTERFAYSYKHHSLNTTIYLSTDGQDTVIEDGIKVVKEKDKKPSFLLKVSRSHKDNLLSSSLLAKMELRSNTDRWNHRIDHFQKWRIGFLYLPSLFSAKEVGYKGKYQTTPTNILLFGFDQTLSGSKILPKRATLNSKTSLNGLLSLEATHPKESDIIALLSHLTSETNIEIKREFINNLYLGMGFNGLIRTSSYAPITLLQNYEAMAFIEKGFGVNNLSFRFYEPLSYDLIREDSLSCGRRIEINLNTKKWQAQGIWKQKEKNDPFAHPTDGYTGVALTREISSSLKVGIAWKGKRDEETVGVQLVIGEGNPSFWSRFIQKDYNLPQAPEVGYTYHSWSNPPSFSGADFEETVAMLDTPEKVAWYTDQYLHYIDTHNDSLFKIYNPKEVFEAKGGNCTEQAGFEAYILRQHGYESYIAGEIARDFTHAICVYKDEGGWNALDYGMMYKVSAKTIEELINKVYPGWFSLSIKDPSTSKTIRQIDSSTKGWLLDWFEEE